MTKAEPYSDAMLETLRSELRHQVPGYHPDKRAQLRLLATIEARDARIAELDGECAAGMKEIHALRGDLEAAEARVSELEKELAQMRLAEVVRDQGNYKPDPFRRFQRPSPFAKTGDT